MIALGLHSFFSLMQATASPRDLCRRARQLGYTTVALTDTNNLHGLWPFLAACRAEGLQPIIGAEISTAASRFFCLVKNRLGYRNLCRLLTLRHCDPAFDPSNALDAHHHGLILAVTETILLRRCRDIGADTVVALTGRPGKPVNALLQAARGLEIAAVAMQDSFFLTRDDLNSWRLLRAIAGNSSLCRLPEEKTDNSEAWLMSPAELEHRFHLWPECRTQTALIAEKCAFRSPYKGLIMPPWQGTDHPDAQLRTMAYQGARQRYGPSLSTTVTTRLEHELHIIATMNFSTYFLVVHDIVGPLARTCGRGSGAASLVAYCLHITNVCPLRHNLYFERFLNPGRQDPPDIDIDFAWDERDRILHSVLERFGCRAAMVANHVTLQPRMALRETAKVFGLPNDEISRITGKLDWTWQNEGHQDGYLNQLRRLPQLRGVDLTGPWPEILRLAARISGIPRYLSVHPGGVIITPEPVSDYVPVQRAAKGVPIIQWEKDGAEEAGLVKIDLLGNRSLGVIRDTLHQVREGGGTLEEQRWHPEDDPATQVTLARGGTMGCFYIESPATRLLQQRSRRGDFNHVVIHSSIIRPAANEFIREYLRRLHGAPWQPHHPLIAGLLDETYGIMVYQEDVSRIAVRFGLSHAEADHLRKIISKKDKERQIKEYQRRFFEAAAARLVPEAATTGIWKMMMSFAGYSFCKPHSASYARISFQAAYLKTHYPAEFMAAVLSNQGGYYSTFAYVSEARRLGLTILPPDVNHAEQNWKGHGSYLRVGLMAIRSLAAATIAQIVSQRRQGRFVSMFDFLRRVCPGEDEAEALIRAGALDSLLPETAAATANRGLLAWLSAAWRKTGRSPATPLFPLDPTPPILPPEHQRERLRNEYKALGFLCASHPITLFADHRRRVGAITAQELLHLPSPALNRRLRVRFLGWLISGKIVATNKGEPMEFLSFEDETDLLECTFFPGAYARFCHLLHTRGPLLLEGYMEEEFGARTLTVERVAEPRNKVSPGRQAADLAPPAEDVLSTAHGK